jgi:hypothetical protein
MKHLISVFILCIVGIAGYSQEQKIDKEKLWADLDTLYSTIYNKHPDMFANISKADFEKKFNETKSRIDKSLTPLEFYNLTAPLVVLLRDGHTVLQPPHNFLKNSHKRLFPFWIEIHDDSTIVVKGDFSLKNEVPVGAIIKSINGISAKELITNGLNYADGEMLFFRYRIPASIFRSLMLFHYNYEDFTIEYVFQKKHNVANIAGIGYDEIFTKNTSSNTEEEPYSLNILGNDIAYIDFKSFMNLSKFKNFIDSAFQVIQNRRIKDLIIDVRYNGGGNSALGDEFFQYISPVPFQQWGQTTVKYSKERHDFYQYHVREYFLPDITDSALIELIGNEPFGSMEVIPADPLIPLRENPLRYFGNTYLLTSNYTFSSAASFAWTFQYFKMGKVIGEETGEPVVNFGDIIYQFLPNTGLQYSVSHKKFYQYGATDQDTHGTIPDIIIPEETALDYTIKMIEKNK